MAQYTNLITSALSDMKEEFPDMSFGEILYSIFRKPHLKTKPDGVNTSWLLDLKDEDIYKAIELTIKSEVKE